MSRKLVIVAVAVAALAITAAGVASTPKQLYTKLLITQYRALPEGFYRAKVGAGELDKRDRRHHAVGIVQIEIDAADAAVYYYVFRTRTDALAWMRDKDYDDNPTLKVVRDVSMGRVPGYKVPSQWRNLTVEGKNVFGKTVRNGVTLMGIVKLNVVVGAATFSTENKASGDVPATLKLLGSANRHLAKVQAKLR